MIETTRYVETMVPRLEPVFQEPMALSQRGGFLTRFDRFDWICVATLLFSFVLVSRLPFAPSKYSDIYFHYEAKQLARVIQGVGLLARN